MDGKIHYLNTDLDLTSANDLTPLTDAFELAGFCVLSSAQADDGIWYATFETGESFEEPDSNISAFLDVIESLAPHLHAIWSRCAIREFNIGYDCGLEPWAFNQSLCSTLLGRMAAIRASLRLTLYPDRSEDKGATPIGSPPMA